MKAIWNGALTFGLINIPVSVYPASEEHILAFHMLHKTDNSPIQYARLCKEDGKEVPYSEIVKGYEFSKGEYVVVTDDDFKAANAKKTSTIEIELFANLGEIDPIYFAKPYYLQANKKSGKAYLLLNAALSKSNKVAIVRFVFRNKEHMGAILPSKEGLLLIQMRYYAEIRPFSELDLPKEKVTQKELEMALSLIDQLTSHFDPKKYHDTYTEDLMKLIQDKLKGKKISQKTDSAATFAPAKDLMQLLKASMQMKTSVQKSLDKTKPAKKVSRPITVRAKQSRKRAA